VLDLDLASIVPSVAGPKRPHGFALSSQAEEPVRRTAAETNWRWRLREIQRRDQGRYFTASVRRFRKSGIASGGEQRPESVSPWPRVVSRRHRARAFGPKRRWSITVHSGPFGGKLIRKSLPHAEVDLGHGDVLIAAITSCTNHQSSVMLAAGLLAKKSSRAWSRCSLVSKELAGRQAREWSPNTFKRQDCRSIWTSSVYLVLRLYDLHRQFRPTHPHIEQVLSDHDLIAASVCPGIETLRRALHQSIKANFLMSPPLVWPSPIAGRVDMICRKIRWAKAATVRTFTARDLARPSGDQRAHECRDESGYLSKTISRLRSAEPAVERNPHQHGKCLQVGSDVNLHSGASLL